MQFEQYVNESRQRLFRFAVVLCGDTVLAGDLLADVLGRAFERWHQVSAARDPHAYVRRMLVNEFVTWQRRRARTAPHPEVGQLADLRASRLGHVGRRSRQTPRPNAPPCWTSCRGCRPGSERRSCCATTTTSAMTTSPATLGCRVGTVRSSISRGLATLRVNTTYFGRQDDVMTRTENDLREALLELQQRADQHGAPVHRQSRRGDERGPAAPARMPGTLAALAAPARRRGGGRCRGGRRRCDQRRPREFDERHSRPRPAQQCPQHRPHHVVPPAPRQSTTVHHSAADPTAVLEDAAAKLDTAPPGRRRIPQSSSTSGRIWRRRGRR